MKKSLLTFSIAIMMTTGTITYAAWNGKTSLPEESTSTSTSRRMDVDSLDGHRANIVAKLSTSPVDRIQEITANIFRYQKAFFDSSDTYRVVITHRSPTLTRPQINVIAAKSRDLFDF